MQVHSTTKGKHLSPSERIQIERLHNYDKFSHREITFRSNKVAQTIHNELKRALVQLKYKTKYSVKAAQEVYDGAKKRCGSHRKLSAQLKQRINSSLRNKYALAVIHQ